MILFWFMCLLFSFCGQNSCQGLCVMKSVSKNENSGAEERQHKVGEKKRWTRTGDIRGTMYVRCFQETKTEPPARCNTEAPYVFFCLRNPSLNQKLQSWHVVLPCCLDGNKNVLQYQQVLTSVSLNSSSIFLEVARSFQKHVLILHSFSLVLLPRQTNDKSRGKFSILHVVRFYHDARTIGEVTLLRPHLCSRSRPVHLWCPGFEGRDEQKEDATECEGKEEADFADAHWSYVHPDWLMETLTSASRAAVTDKTIQFHPLSHRKPCRDKQGGRI